jgi:lipoprotein-anchoring transpeptidase ErfK/SrfK
LVKRLQRDDGMWWHSRHLLVDIDRQTLGLYEGARRLGEYRVSTGLKGVGEEHGSGCTPRGLHRVRIRIGEGCPTGTVFRGRRPTGEIYDSAFAAEHPGRDWILTRILWLTGSESGHNRGGRVDTLRRFIYIHGCPETEPMGVPRSHGCIRMRCPELIELFDRTPVGTHVLLFGTGGPEPADSGCSAMAPS